MLEAFLFILGLTDPQPTGHAVGQCRGIGESPVACVVTEYPHGIKYVRTPSDVYRLRPVFWGGHTEIRHTSGTARHDICRMENKDIYCLSSLVFIADEEVPPNPYSPSVHRTPLTRGNTR